MSANGGDADCFKQNAGNLAHPSLSILPPMKNITLTVALIATSLALSACNRERRHPRQPDRGPRPPTEDVTPPPADTTAPHGNNLPDPTPTPGTVPPPPTSPPANVVPPPPQQAGPAPYGVKVDGKPGFISSPFATGKLIDVRGLPPGTEIECPYTNRPILVP